MRICGWLRRFRLALLCACTCLTLPAQNATVQADTPTLHISTQLVLVDASVQLKRTGESLEGLTLADFALTEDGAPQTIKSLSEDQLPLSLVLLFDLTDTVHPLLVHLAGGAAAALRHLRPIDEVAVMSFSSRAQLVQPFTRDRMTAVEGIDDASATYEKGEPTFVFEDLWEAAKQSATTSNPEARRVQIWLTDGSANDAGSERGLAHHAPAALHTETEAAEALLQANTVVSALIEREARPLSTGHYGDLEHYAELTGGPVIQATAGNADERLASLLDTLRHRYTLGYRPSATRAPGTVCHLHVSLSAAFFAAHPRVRAKDILLHSRESYVR